MIWYDFNSVLANVRHDLNFVDDVLWLDFGHGGKISSGGDSGGIFYDKSMEKDYVLDFGLRVYKILRPYFEKIYLTRTSDVNVELNHRASLMSKLAKKVNTLHVYSIHTNAWNKTANGAEILLSITINKNDTDYVYSLEFLKQYCKVFGLANRGIVQRKGRNGNYYCLHRDTPKNCKVKIVELFFGDNKHDFDIGKSADFKNKAAFLLASSILKRYGVKIEKPKPIKPSNLMFYVQAGAFKDYKNAEKLQKQLKLKGFDSIIKSQKIK